MSLEKTGPCAGLKILELGTSMVSGPLCGQILGDLGGDVIKVEGRHGDMMRTVPPIHDGMSGQFLQFNRNKRSIVLDFKDPADREVVMELIRQADVLVENFRPGVTKRLGLDYEAVRAENERLVYVSVNGFGATGPYAALPAYDQVIQGIAGFMNFQGTDEEPAAIKSVMVDKITALSAATAALGALVHRERGGSGQHVEVRMLDAFAAIMLPELLASRTFADQPAGRLPSKSIYRTMRTLDGHVVGLIVQDSQFQGICRALGCDELLQDERFATAPGRFVAMEEILTILETKTSTMTTRDLLDLLWKDSEIAIGPVNDLDAFLHDPQVKFNETVVESDDPELGRIRQLGPFASFESTPLEARGRAPRLGEHSGQIRADLGR